MRAIITYADIGTTIDFRSVGPYEARHPWPDETVVSAGRGVVFSRGKKVAYTTLFMECYPPEDGFLRGEGATPEECEDAAWAKYQRALHCLPGQSGHEWEPRGYRNGGGFCKHCDTFRAKCFTGDELGQHCSICGEGTTYAHKMIDEEYVFTCQEHTPVDRRGFLEMLNDIMDEDPEPVTGTTREG